jgi:hypothetical protein
MQLLVILGQLLRNSDGMLARLAYQLRGVFQDAECARRL